MESIPSSLQAHAKAQAGVFSFYPQQQSEKEKERLGIRRGLVRTHSSSASTASDIMSERRFGGSERGRERDRESWKASAKEPLLRPDDFTKPVQIQVQRAESLEDGETALRRDQVDAVRQIQSDAESLNRLQREVASRVAEQGQDIDTIESQMIVAQQKMQETVVQLEIGRAAAETRRRRKARVLCILMVSLLLITGFLMLINRFAPSGRNR
uniref:t-SNARE coiled-coil homology domain-containing protein n=1 Tax=Chromera velia CCMP2878 TaxID=1169474 RepID=A0A0G4IBZ4_9ALVE|mmetsp:Transcript_12069/g.23284  ORF Transcript_12069/g.23284 Transcript_12069/m.23284 type:complete len:212 (+) Transcript_12069:455-1090(+)|eukprot:Cvel_12982.t1-p1 / transcript=Cvel_12982.t1 / gene=Cvel_12982 / organism=Chromera_velia_CCMP2878 / gene_product=hypothetical protein / transcript_product=hypothetical protein / location=Cvel_scaffold870:21365-21997(+) / protein_length=211 / sequence_SO=supercontig / SO=protein_coding / is_pseudo=false